MKKLILSLILLLVLSGCVDVETPIVVEDGDILPENICESLDRVMVIKKIGCPGCAIAVPKLQELEEELGKEFIYYDTAIEKQRNELLSLGFVPSHVPAVVVDCKVYIGALEKEKYKELIEEWLMG